jgi:heparan-alpha-glucosaminide N-acetyltransferase
MIFVNDLWSLNDIPAWLGHVASGVDGIGLADTVFPAFLFIVGMSIPFAFENRIKKGDTDRALFFHVLTRTVALLIMGVFLVNGEGGYINEEATGIPRLAWNVICCTSFIAIWNIYPDRWNKTFVLAIRGVAIMILLFLAIIYRGGNEGLELFQPRWWGILGLIGWSYLAAGMVSIYAKGSMKITAIAWVIFALLSMLWHAKLIPSFLHFIPNPIIGGTGAGLTMGGVLTSLIFVHYQKKNDTKTLTRVLLIAAAVLIALSVITRPYWGLRKLGATPAWLFLCSAFTLLAFLVIFWVADQYKRSSWFSMIRPAGTDTLLTYLMPYFSYAATRALGIRIPEPMLYGSVGLIKSFLFALFCVGVVRLISMAGIRLKL